MQQFTKGALWGIVPSILFFVKALLCFRKGLPLSAVLVSSFGARLRAALFHQLLLKGTSSSGLHLTWGSSGRVLFLNSIANAWTNGK